VHDVSAQICERAALPDEIVDEKIGLSPRHFAIEHRRSDHAFPSCSAGVIDDVRLNDPRLDFEVELFAEQLREGRRNSVISLVFKGVHRHQSRLSRADQSAD